MSNWVPMPFQAVLFRSSGTSTQCQLEVQEPSERELLIVLAGDAVAQTPLLLTQILREASQ